MNNKKLVLELIAVVAAGVLSAQAEVINVNFTGMQTGLDGTEYAEGVAPLSYPGTTWNEWAGFQNGRTELKDSEGNTTTAGFSPVTAGSTPGIAGNVDAVNMMRGYGFIQGGDNSTTFTISGLDAHGEYRLAIVSRGSDSGSGGTFQVGDKTLVSVGTGPTNQLAEGVNMVIFDSVFADGSGTLNFSVTLGPGGNNSAVINAFQIEAISEQPATLGLITAMGGGKPFVRPLMM